MKCIIVLAAALLLNATAQAEDFHVGPFTGSWQVIKTGKSAWIRVTATNESGATIRKVLFCLRNRKAKPDDCAGLFWNDGVWQPGETISWDKDLPVPVKSGAEIRVTLLIPDEKINNVRKLYVEPLTGNGADMARDQLKALIVNTPGFKLEEASAPDVATLTGHAETWDAGSTSSTSGRATTSRGIFAVRTVAIGSSASKSSSQGKTETIVAEGLVLRLTLNGESIWAWDDSKPCSSNVTDSTGSVIPGATGKVKCAIEDLLASVFPFPLAIR